ncbi:putative holin [Pseudomonas chlororaphis]|uniref:putative holin n=1 Tax=Pseudomonas chlororaphis TaxID=587753 RepID=UPI001E4AA562|nr:putative holin [Pseudomonas chlororaphis]MCB2256639.1 putative holin [Pseudomonas chlororaphis]
MTDWTLITLVLLICLALVAPTKLPVVLYKAGLVTLGGVLGYWIDRALFPYARPNQVQRTDRAMAGVRRALVVLACILGLTLGL